MQCKQRSLFKIFVQPMEKLNMKKTLIALAAVAVTSTAFAQSSVTISGQLDISAVTRTTEKDYNAGVERAKIRSSATGNDSYANSSYITFSGKEDLGGGLSAFFTVESGVGEGFAESYRFLGLEGGFGKLTFGRFENQFGELRGATYSLGDVAIGGDALGTLVNPIANFFFDPADPTSLEVINALNTHIDSDSDRSIQYLTPEFNGFTFGITLSNNATKETAQGALAEQIKARSEAFSGRYQEGNLDVYLVHGRGKTNLFGEFIDENDQLFDADFQAKLKNTALRVGYDFGVVNAYVATETGKVTASGVGENGWLKSRATEAGLAYPVGAFSPFVTVGRAKITNEDGLLGKASMLQLGTTYDLSKRTQLYVATGRTKAKDNDGLFAKLSGYTFGMKHSF